MQEFDRRLHTQCDVQRIEPRQFYYDSDFPRFYTAAAGIKGLLALNPQVAVMEPTGVNYMKLWAVRLAEAGVEIVLVGHVQLRSCRINLGLPDKDDNSDALALFVLLPGTPQIVFPICPNS